MRTVFATGMAGGAIADLGMTGEERRRMPPP
jgi:hypothetical protein